MKFYISTSGIKRVKISNAGKGSPLPALANRRISCRALLAVALVLGIVLPFLFVRVAFFVLESASVCSSTLDCIRGRFDTSVDTSQNLKEELTRAMIEATDVVSKVGLQEGSLDSFDELVKDMISNPQDIKAFAFKTKAMLSRMERKVQSARQRESVYWHLASHGVPMTLHCLCLKLAEEYAVNAVARSRLPSPEYVSRLINPSFHHVVLMTDNVLAASVVISSTVQNSARPEKLVFHIVTDKKTYSSMHAWFAMNPIKVAVVEVKGLHQYDWSYEVNVEVKEMLEIQRLIWSHYYNSLKQGDFRYEGEHSRYLEVLNPSCLSLINHLRIYIPELFPDLDKLVLLDDDVVVQHDISSLWDLELNEKVVGAVFDSWCGYNCCPGRKYKDYLNFSHPIISSNFDPDNCAWLYGMNVLDLGAWRRTNITTTYHKWLKTNLISGLALWQPGVLPPSLIAFEGNVHPIDPSWHISGLGQASPKGHTEILKSAVVLHFSGPAKPWLEIGFPEVRSFWNSHVNFSNKFIRKCGIMR